MSDPTHLARQSLRAAMQLRRHLSIPREVPVCAFDVAKMIGADVRFLDAPSLEGMLVRDPGLRVLLPSTRHRPKARILFSCAHEIGHHQLGHGTKVDRYLSGESGQFDDEEYLADSFAGHLLMPRPAVLSQFERRGWSAHHPSELEVFCVAGELGVGYETLLTHMNVVLGLISNNERAVLKKHSPKSIRASLFGAEDLDPVLILDQHWSNQVIDLEVGDNLFLTKGCEVASDLLEVVQQDSQFVICRARHAGQERINTLNSECTLRVARKHYTGPFQNRYLVDPDEH